LKSHLGGEKGARWGKIQAEKLAKFGEILSIISNKWIFAQRPYKTRQSQESWECQLSWDCKE
jgi:hypothetical protein